MRFFPHCTSMAKTSFAIKAPCVSVAGCHTRFRVIPDVAQMLSELRGLATRIVGHSWETVPRARHSLFTSFLRSAKCLPQNRAILGNGPRASSAASSGAGKTHCLLIDSAMPFHMLSNDPFDPLHFSLNFFEVLVCCDAPPQTVCPVAQDVV